MLGRLEARNLAVNQEILLTWAALAAAAVGFLAAGGIGRAAGWGRWWPLLSTAVAALLLIGIVAQALGLDLVPELIALVAVGLLIPAWALWLARSYSPAT